MALLCVLARADDGTVSGLKVVYGAYRQCEDAADPLVCLKARALKLLDRAIATDNIPLVDGKYPLKIMVILSRI